MILLFTILTTASVVYIQKKKTTPIQQETKKSCENKAACDCDVKETPIDFKKQIKEHLLKEEEPNYLDNNLFFGTYDKPEYPYIQVL
jgi:hypothetical protein